MSKLVSRLMNKSIKLIFGLLLVQLSITSMAKDYAFEVEKVGQGQPVILIPGFASSGEVWNDVVEGLKEDYELHVLTLAGFAGVKPVDFPWLPKVKDSIERYIQDKQLKKPIVIGHSMGGTLGLWIAADNPQLLGKVINVDGLPAMGALMIPDYDPEILQYDSPYNNQVLAMDDIAFDGMAKQFAMQMTLNPDKRHLIIDGIKNSDRQTYVYGYTDLLKTDLRKNLANIKVPVTVFAATQPYGKEAVEMNYKKQLAHLRDYKLIFAENSAHFIMFDEAQWFLDQLKSELKLELKSELK